MTAASETDIALELMRRYAARTGLTWTDAFGEMPSDVWYRTKVEAARQQHHIAAHVDRLQRRVGAVSALT
jgi:hypothetical protein